MFLASFLSDLFTSQMKNWTR